MSEKILRKAQIVENDSEKFEKLSEFNIRIVIMALRPISRHDSSRNRITITMIRPSFLKYLVKKFSSHFLVTSFMNFFRVM